MPGSSFITRREGLHVAGKGYVKLSRAMRVMLVVCALLLQAARIGCKQHRRNNWVCL